MILALWNHVIQMGQYRNDALHEEDNKRVALIKVEALDRYIERLATRHNNLQSKLHNFKEIHMER
jgi:hypothetical protein